MHIFIDELLRLSWKTLWDHWQVLVNFENCYLIAIETAVDDAYSHDGSDLYGTDTCNAWKKKCFIFKNSMDDKSYLCIVRVKYVGSVSWQLHKQFQKMNWQIIWKPITIKNYLQMKTNLSAIYWSSLQCIFSGTFPSIWK